MRSALLAFLLVLAAAVPDAARAATSWIPIGPNDVAMVTALAGGRSAVYAATCNGVYRSDDGATSWHETGLQRLNAVRLAVDPNGIADTLYAIVDNRVFVSWRPEPSQIALSGLVLGSSLWVSTDGGRTWSDRELDSGHAVAVDLSQPGTAYVASYGSYYPVAVTHDFGTTWTTVPDAPAEIFSSLAVDPRDGTLYAASSFLSILSGGSWSSLAIQVTLVAAGSGLDGAGTIYAAGQNTFCRKPGAASWSCVAIPQDTPIDIVEIPAQPHGTGARILLLTFGGILSSDDGGVSFSPVASHPPGYTPAAALDPSGTAVYAGNDIGVYRSVDRGATWTSSNAGLSSTWVRALAIDPHDGSTILAGGEARIYDIYHAGPGLFRSTDGGDSWSSVSVSGEPGYVFSLALDPSNPQNLFTASVAEADRTTDGGATWTTTASGTFHNFIDGLAVDPTSSSKVWAATDSLKKSDDGGATWSKVLSRSVFSLLFDSRHPGTIYAGESWEEPGFYYPYGSGFAVETSRDNGATWRSTGDTAYSAVTALADDPFSDAVYASTLFGTILRSTDAGATWARWNSSEINSWLFALIADPAREGTLYIGGWGGAYRSQDGGNNWELFSDGLEPLGVLGLAISPEGRYLYAGTTGGGVFRRDLALDRAPPSTVSGARTTREVSRP